MTMPLLTAPQLELLFLTFLRVVSMITVMPVFGERTVAMRVKAGLALIITFLIFPSLAGEEIAASNNMVELLLRMAGEIFIGIIIAFIIRFFFAAIQLSGQLIGFQMGFAIANIVDPLTSTQVSIIAELYYLFAILLFLSFDLHHIFLFSIVESYKAIPPLGMQFTGKLAETILLYSKNIFITAVKIGAPVITALLFTNVGLGVVARTVPQMNIFIVGFPLQIAMGLLFIGLTAFIFSSTVEKTLLPVAGQIKVLLRLMGGS